MFPPKVFTAIEKQVLSRSRDFDPAGICAVLQAFTTSKIESPAIYNVFHQQIKDRCSEFDVDDLDIILTWYEFNKAGVDVAGVAKTVQNEMKRRIESKE